MEFSCFRLYRTVGLKSALSCEAIPTLGFSNVFRFDNPFDGLDGGYAGDEPLSIVFNNIELPGANLWVKGIKIETYATIENVDYLVDSLVDFELRFFAPVQLFFLSSNVLAGSDEVYTATYFTLEHQLANKVPFGAIMYVTIPP